MKIKSVFLGLWATGMILGMADLSLAQMVTLPVLDTASPRDQGSLEVTPGMTMGNEMDFTGARATVTATDDLRGFFDLGRLDTKDDGANLALQAGALYNMPMTDLCNTAIRGALYYSKPDPLTIYGGNIMMVFSDETFLNDLFLYSAVGLDMCRRETLNTSTELNPAFAAGLSYKITDNFVLFLEGDFVDGLYGSCGLSIR